MTYCRDLADHKWREDDAVEAERLRCLAWIDTIRGAFSSRDTTYTVLGNLRKEIERGNEPPQKVMKI